MLEVELEVALKHIGKGCKYILIISKVFCLFEQKLGKKHSKIKFCEVHPSRVTKFWVEQRKKSSKSKLKGLFLKLQIWQTSLATLEAQTILVHLYSNLRCFFISFPKMCVPQAKKQFNIIY